jgi:hypothetical protein
MLLTLSLVIVHRSPGGEESDEESGTWVTVFGFPPSQASYVLKLFQELGEVVRHKTPVGQCNWMHIQYVIPSPVWRRTWQASATC